MATGRERLSDEALVVRCGRPPYDDPTPLREKCIWYHGCFGFSVQCADGVPLEELAALCPNRRIGITTVGEIRLLGYDVVVTPGKGHHATVAVAQAWSQEDSKRLVSLFREEGNPAPRKAR
jgi:hypothetical protein